MLQVRGGFSMQYGRDWFIETLPEVIDLVKQGKAEGEVHALRQVVLDAVHNRFPSLDTFAQAQVALISNPTLLRQLVPEIFLAADKTAIQKLLQGHKS